MGPPGEAFNTPSTTDLSQTLAFLWPQHLPCIFTSSPLLVWRKSQGLAFFGGK